MSEVLLISNPLDNDEEIVDLDLDEFGLDEESTMPPPTEENLYQNYAFLNSPEMLSYVEGLTKEIKDMDEILESAGQLFSLQSIDALAEYVSQMLLGKFVPSYLGFVLQEDLNQDTPTIVCFKNMKPMDNSIEIPSMAPYKHFFSLSPTPVEFRVFEYMVGKASLTDPFLPLNPRKVIPILGFDGVYGLIIVGAKVVGGEYTDAESRYLERLIRLVSLSFQNNIHYRRAILDFKTKLYNHSFFTMRLEEELSRLQRYKSQLTLIMLDVDYFKKFNDNHGHLAGDLVLEEVAQILKGMIRKEDVAARFGGEEFVILLVQCNANYGWLIAERIRKAIKDHALEFEGKELKVTVSLGVAHIDSENLVPDPDSFVKMADMALYQSKEKGRNRTTIYDHKAKT